MSNLVRVTQPTLAVLEVLLAEELGTWGLHIAGVTGLKPGTIYPILDRLEEAGWVISFWENEVTRDAPKRKYFVLMGHMRQPAEKLISDRKR
jgi:DNA-binding MarR family transcriptional regulator